MLKKVRLAASLNKTDFDITWNIKKIDLAKIAICRINNKTKRTIYFIERINCENFNDLKK